MAPNLLFISLNCLSNVLFRAHTCLKIHLVLHGTSTGCIWFELTLSCFTLILHIPGVPPGYQFAPTSYCLSLDPSASGLFQTSHPGPHSGAHFTDPRAGGTPWEIRFSLKSFVWNWQGGGASPGIGNPS